jgi:hypothetical protein
MAEAAGETDFVAAIIEGGDDMPAPGRMPTHVSKGNQLWCIVPFINFTVHDEYAPTNSPHHDTVSAWHKVATILPAL